MRLACFYQQFAAAVLRFMPDRMACKVPTWCVMLQRLCRLGFSPGRLTKKQLSAWVHVAPPGQYEEVWFRGGHT